jgi:hypothetical protein
VDKDVGKDPVFEPFRRQAKAPKRAKSSKKRWTQDDFCAFFDDGSDPLLLLVGILTNSTCTAARLVKVGNPSSLYHYRTRIGSGFVFLIDNYHCIALLTGCNVCESEC